MKQFLLFSTLFLFSFFRLFAQQQDGYFGVWHNGENSQKWAKFKAIEEWEEESFNNFWSSQMPIDIEFYEDESSLNIFQLYQEIRDVTWWYYYEDNITDFLSINEQLKKEEGVRLVDFEKYRQDGKDWFFGLWITSQETQELKIVETIDEWLIENENLLQRGYSLIDFEKYDIDGKEFYYGLWKKQKTQQRIQIVNSLKEFESINTSLTRDEGLKLVEFEKYESNGESKYFGMWESGLELQEFAVFNSLESWSETNDRLNDERDLILIDFEKFEDSNVPPILPKERVIRDSDLIGNQSYFWSRDTSYILDGNVHLESGGVLNIQEGTIIRAIDSTCLVIDEGARIFANGSENNPIIFSSKEIMSQSGSYYSGKWGGLTIYGKEEFSSGSLTYISIRHAGQNKNDTIGSALTLWEVDKKTEINHIEIYTSKGYGININGNDTEIAYASVSYAKESSFRWDKGWTGSGIYWFSHYSGAIEGNGHTSDLNAVVSNPYISNVTYIGTSCYYDTGQKNQEVALLLKNNSKGTLVNSVYVDLSEDGIQIEDIIGNNDSYVSDW